MFDQTATYNCAYCGSENTVDVDISGGLDQVYYEDCEICSRANKVHVIFDEKKFVVSVKAIPEF